MLILQELKTKGFKVSVVNGDTLMVVPGSNLTPELTKRLKAHKPEIIKALSTGLPADYYDSRIREAIAEFNSFGIKYTDVPKTKRRQADKFDREMTEAANHGDRETFLVALKQWRRCFH